MSTDARVDLGVGSDAADLGSPRDATADAGVDLGVDGGNTPDAGPRDLGAIDAAPFPIKLAYGASAEAPLLQELYLTDTSTSRTKVNGPMAGGPAGGKKEPATGGLQNFQWSADGQRLYYRAQQETFDLAELYVVDAGGTRPGPWRKLSLPGATSYADEVSPSFVSAHVAFSQYENAQTNLYVVSATTASPAPRQLSQGFAFQNQWSPTADQIVFHDIIVSASDRDLWFAGTYPGAPAPVRVNPGANLGFGGALAWAPDGSSFVYTADESALRVFELFRVTVTNGLLGPRQRLHPAFGPTADIGFDKQVASAFSPDASKIAYVADPRVTGLDELFIIDLEGGAPSAPMTLSATTSNAYSVERFSFDPTGSFIVYATRDSGSNLSELFLVNVDGSGSAIPLEPQAQLGAHVREEWARDGDLLILHYFDGAAYSLYAVEPRVSGALVRLDVPVNDGGPGALFWSLSPDKRRLLYANQLLDGSSALNTVDLADLNTATSVFLLATTVGPSWCWPTSPSSAIAVIADLETPGTGELYFVPDVVNSSFIKVSGPLVAGGQVQACAFAP